LKSRGSMEQLIELIPEVIAIPILLSDGEGIVVYANGASQEALLASEKKLCGKKVEDLFPEIENFPKYFKDSLKGTRIIIFDSSIRGLKGEKFPLSYLEFSLLLTPGGGKRYVTISFRKKEESFVEKILGVKEKEDDKFEIVWKGISHEIKNPLGGIRGAAQMLQRGLRRNSPFIHHSEVILREADRINRFLDSLSCSQKVEITQTIDLPELLKENLELIKAHIATTKKQIDLRLIADRSLPAISGDRDALFRAFANLLKNSVEAIDQKGIIQITLKLHEDLVFRADGEERIYIIEIEFFDSGRKIPEDQIPNLFLPFFTDKPGGTGMGLFFVNQTVQFHGGSIKVKSVPDGKAFRIYFPLRKEDH